MLQPGMKRQQEMIVTAEKSAEAMGSGTLPVFATPAMVALMEETAWKCVSDELEEGSSTVGTSLNIKHIAATPVGMKVRCEAVLTEVEGRRLVFSVDVYDASGKVGEGLHERFIIFNEKFTAKANQKLNK